MVNTSDEKDIFEQKREKFRKLITKKYKSTYLGFIHLKKSNHPMYYSNTLMRIFAKYNIPYYFHITSTKSDSIYFYIDEERCIRVSDHNIEEGDINFMDIEIEHITAKGIAPHVSKMFLVKYPEVFNGNESKI